MGNRAPVVLFVYNRPLHTKRCLDALDKCALAQDTCLYIFADGSKGEKDKDDVEKTRNIIADYKKYGRFRDVNIELAQSNSGLRKSVISGVSKIINEYGRVIVLEDDLVTSEDFLLYMNDALDFYEKVPKVWSVSGYTPSIRSLRNYTKDVYMVRRGGSWGWATWADRWNTIDWTAGDYKEFVKDKKRVRDFRSLGHNLPEMLDAQMNGMIDSWAILFTYEKFKQEKYTVYPRISRIKNIGNDGTGTHKHNRTKWDTELNTGCDRVSFIQPELDEVVNCDFYNFYAGNLIERVGKRIWYHIIKLKR